MGRQTIWGGVGKPPSRDVMPAAAKAARHEMMQRIRDNKGEQGARGGSGNGGTAAPQWWRQRCTQRLRCAATATAGATVRSRKASVRSSNPARRAMRSLSAAAATVQNRQREDHDDDRMPSNIDPLRTNMPGRRDMNGLQRVNVGGQPDPTRTSIDSMGAGRRGGGGNRRGGGGGNGARAPSRFAR